MSRRKPNEITLPAEIGDGRLDLLLALFASFPTLETQTLRLNWRKVTDLSPAGSAILACLADTALEQGKKLEHLFLPSRLKARPIIQSLQKTSLLTALPKPSIYDFDQTHELLGSGENHLNIAFVEKVAGKFGKTLSDDQLFGVRLILHELMQNSVDHSTAERYYLYAGIWEKEFHFGVLDMGITIPAKLESKYLGSSDSEYLELALKTGISTRRLRPGGLGLSHTFEFLKEQQGRLTLISRGAQLRRYFKRRHIVSTQTKAPLRGTWCFARFET